MLPIVPIRFALGKLVVVFVNWKLFKYTFPAFSCDRFLKYKSNFKYAVDSFFDTASSPQL